MEEDGNIIVECRYEWYSKSGVTWTKWFDSNHFNEIGEAENFIKENKKYSNKSKKYKREYRIKNGNG